MSNETANGIPFYSGCFSGFTTRLLTQPLEVVKIRIQNEPLKNGSYYTGFLQCLSRITKEEGYKGLFKGHIAAQFLSISYTGIQFGLFDFLKKKNQSDFTSGFISGFLAVFVSQPIDMIRTRLISQDSKMAYKGFPDAFIKVIKSEGFFALWRGINCNILMTPFQTAIHFIIYSKLSEQEILKPFIKGAIAGIVAKTAVYPFDLARKRMEIVGFEKSREKFGSSMKLLAPSHYKKIQYFLPRFALVDCWMQLVKKDGLAGLYKGYFPSIIKAAVASSLSFTFYEFYFSMFQRLSIFN